MPLSQPLRSNALGRRVEKTVDGTTTQFLGASPERSRRDGLNPVQELNGSPVANMLTGLNIDEYFVRTEPSCCGPLRYLTDALGSTIALVDSTGTTQYNYQYEPFGENNSTIFNVNTTSTYEFTGREEDEIGVGSGLMYYRGCYYNPAYQRFISQDPIDFAGGDTNLYAYSGNDPVYYTDNSGLAHFGFRPLETSGQPLSINWRRMTFSFLRSSLRRSQFRRILWPPTRLYCSITPKISIRSCIEQDMNTSVQLDLRARIAR